MKAAREEAAIADNSTVAKASCRNSFLWANLEKKGKKREKKISGKLQRNIYVCA
jgi:hypothetical protein